MKNSDKKFEMWVENPYPNMTVDNTNYYELIVARANIYKKATKLEAKGLLMIFVSGMILVLPHIFPSIDFLSFIRSVFLFAMAFFIPLMHVILADRKKILAGYITKPDYEGLLNMISNKSMNKIVSTISSTMFAGIVAYICYLMWITPFLWFVNYLACMITTYSSIAIWLIVIGKTQSNKKMLQEVLSEQNMLMKDLYDDIEAWVLAESKD